MFLQDVLGAWRLDTDLPPSPNSFYAPGRLSYSSGSFIELIRTAPLHSGNDISLYHCVEISYWWGRQGSEPYCPHVLEDWRRPFYMFLKDLASWAFVLFLYKDLFFWNRFRFTTKLERRYRDSHIPSTPTHAHPSHCHYHWPEEHGFTKHQPTSTHHSHPHPQFTLEFALGVYIL